MTSATAFAPATVANVAIGFDILGHSVQGIGDHVTARLTDLPGVHIRSIKGVEIELPMDAEHNTAGRSVMALWEYQNIDIGIDLEIVKGVPQSSGMGGSAASAVAAVVAANALLSEPADQMTLLRCAMLGEQVASGSIHLDNISASLFGGLVLTVGVDQPRIKRIPVPEGIRCVLVHPHMKLNTREARSALNKTVSLSDFVWQTANIAGFICGCYSNDLDLIRDAFQDVVIEPQRQALIPGFRSVRAVAMSSGALGCSISGAGPSMFAWCEAPCAESIRTAMVAMFSEHGLTCDAWITPIELMGARVLQPERSSS